MNVSRRTVLAAAAGTAAAYASSGQQAQAAAGPAPASTVRTLRAAADYAVDKVRSVAPGVNGFPVGTKFEKWVYSQNGDWVGGFWPGTLWMAWLYSGDATFRTLALDSAKKLAPRQTDTGTQATTGYGALPHRIFTAREREHEKHHQCTSLGVHCATLKE